MVATMAASSKIPNAGARAKKPSTPDAVSGGVPPASIGHHDHSFTLQAVMEMQKQLGGLVEAVNSLKVASEKSAASVDATNDKVSALSHKIYAAGVVLAIVVAVGAFFANKAWDLMIQLVAPVTGS